MPQDTRRAPLDYSGAADYTNLSVRHLQQLVHTRQVPYIKVGNRLVRFLPDDLDRWLESQRVDTAS